MKNTILKGRWLAAAMCLSLPCLAQAAAQPATAEASITNLTYRLVDLTPDDGQTPWLKMNQVDFALGSTSPEGRDGNSIFGNPLPLRRLVAISEPLTFAEVAPDALVTQARSTGPYRLKPGITLAPGNTQVLDERSSVVSAYDSPDMGGPRGLVLAPHTTLVFQGTALLNTLADASSGVFHADSTRVRQPHAHQVSSSVQIHIGFRAEPAFGQDLGTPWHAESKSVDLRQWLGGESSSSGSPVSNRELKPFEFSLTNDSDFALPAYFHWYLNSEITATVTAVPEPGTWALVAVGLAMIPLQRRLKQTRP